MEFNEQLRQYIQRCEALKDSICTEEATKTSMIMPFFQMLGYDVFNPLEFVPEYTADVGMKKGEKVDYAIVIDTKPLILIECKSCNENLEKHSSQLFRYFGTTTEAKFAILTNGTTYQFYTDLENKNRMDETPFLTINLLDLKDRDVNELKKFTKGSLDIDNILNSAEDLKYSRLIKEWFSKELESPSIDFVKLALTDIYEGVKNQKVIDKFTPIVKRANQQFINDLMNNKIKSALNKEEIEDNSEQPGSEETKVISKIVTTVEELEAYAIVKSILRKIISCDRITYRDTESYFGILLDDNGRKWVCRIHLNTSNKHITVPNEDKKPVRYELDSIDDLYNYSNEIIAACERYL